MLEIASRRRKQAPPRWVVFEALTQLDRKFRVDWLSLGDGEVRPKILQSVEPELVVWSSIWPWRPDAKIRFDIGGGAGSETDLRWTLFVDEPAPDDETVVAMRKRLNVMINSRLRANFDC